MSGVNGEKMKIEAEIKQINNEIRDLKLKRIELIRDYVKPFADKAANDIVKFRNTCVESEVYTIHLLIDDKKFKSRLKKKHQIVDAAHKSIDDEFANQKIMITGAI